MKITVKLVALASLGFVGVVSCSSTDDTKVEEVEQEILATNVLEYTPAFGQFINELPNYTEGDTPERMREKAELFLKSGRVVTLGGFGGSIVIGFDHTVPNIEGKRDFRILGNAFADSAEPGIIWVAYDKNKNGIADADEWFEIQGSEHTRAEVIRNYQITYYRPEKNADDSKEEIAHYIRWKDNQGNTGWKSKNQFHHQSYYPQWVEADSLVFQGTLLPNNAEKVAHLATVKLNSFAWGYADNHPNNKEGSTLDIDWAVDANGNKVHLPGIDFIKVYTALNQEVERLGETSTEVGGAIDLHLEELKKQILK